MKRMPSKKIILGTAALGIASLGLVGVANAAEAVAGSPSSTVVSSRSGIARYTVKSDRQQAIAEVLGMSQSDLQTALKTQSMAAILTSKNLSKTDFKAKVKAQLQTDLKNQGYSQSQIDKALGKHAHKQPKPKNS